MSSDPNVGVYLLSRHCKVSYPHYIDRVYGTKVGPFSYYYCSMIYVIMICSIGIRIDSMLCIYGP